MTDVNVNLENACCLHCWLQVRDDEIFQQKQHLAANITCTLKSDIRLWVLLSLSFQQTGTRQLFPTPWSPSSTSLWAQFDPEWEPPAESKLRWSPRFLFEVVGRGLCQWKVAAQGRFWSCRGAEGPEARKEAWTSGWVQWAHRCRLCLALCMLRVTAARHSWSATATLEGRYWCLLVGPTEGQTVNQTVNKNWKESEWCHGRSHCLCWICKYFMEKRLVVSVRQEMTLLRFC